MSRPGCPAPPAPASAASASASVDSVVVAPPAKLLPGTPAPPPARLPVALGPPRGRGGGGGCAPVSGGADPSPRLLFPPTVFTDATYAEGALLRAGEGEAVLRRRGDADRGSERGGFGLGIGRDYFAPEPDDGRLRGGRRAKGSPEYAYGCDGGESRGGGSLPPRRLVPALTDEEARAWRHPYAASAAAARRFPVEAARLLGTVTLVFVERVIEEGGADLLEQGREYSDREGSVRSGGGGGGGGGGGAGADRRTPDSKFARLYATVSRKDALRDAREDLGLTDGAADGASPVRADEKEEEEEEVEARVEARAERARLFWKSVKDGPPRYECWDRLHGGFVRDALGDDPRHVPLPALARWATDGVLCRWDSGGGGGMPTCVSDAQEGRVASLYGGLRRVPTDARSVLASLLDLSSPRGLYGVPLLVPYAVAEVVDGGGEFGDAGDSAAAASGRPKKKKRGGRRKGRGRGAGPARSWRVRIGVYCNRLLPEVLTCRNLHVVMSALDAGSYRVTEPLHLPPMRDPDDPVFDSAPTPAVRMEEARDVFCAEGGGVDLTGEEVEEEEKKEEDEEGDAALLLSTREEATISPFTPRGLLKLLENKGNDISNWPRIKRAISPTLKLDLMLHQKHAICWMVQMESLGGFGINSILWEEREFFDGGKYYYSPALGQMRLGRPPAMKGGLLCDEMGLGKTLEVLGLIVATLDELKEEASAGGPDYTHATLVIVPPALAMQWVKEIRKAAGGSLSVATLDAKTGYMHRSSGRDGGLPDVVVATYGALGEARASRRLASSRWGRIVLDEMQEVRSSTTRIARACERLRCRRRWMLSGTPLFEGIDDLRGELNFLHLEPYAAGLEDGFFDFSVTNHWRARSGHGLETLRILGLLMLRRSKDMTVRETGLPLLGLKKLTVEFVPVPQRASERALYCWMEYLVSQELRMDDDSRDLKSRTLCLRLLRELCISTVLLNGGLGVASKLSAINQLMTNANRRAESEQLDTERRRGDDGDGDGRKRRGCMRVASCDEALRFLTQARRSANVGDEFVSDVAFGGGRAVSQRSHAMDSAEDQFRAAQEGEERAAQEKAEAVRKRAKARWHLALERVTTGALWGARSASGVSGKFSSLWGWRYVVSGARGGGRVGGRGLPAMLTRGWRPSPAFLRGGLYASRPEFAWAHPRALQLEGIPEQVTVEEVREAIFEAAKRGPAAAQVVSAVKLKLQKEDKAGTAEKLRSDLANAEGNLRIAEAHDCAVVKPTIIRSRGGGLKWRATLQFHNGEDLRFVLKRAGLSNGFALKSSAKIPHIEKEIETAKSNISQAESENKVYPCPINQKKYSEAKKAHRQASLGLRVVSGEQKKAKNRRGNPVISRSVEPFRTLQPHTRKALLDSMDRQIIRSIAAIEEASTRIIVSREKMARLAPALNCPSKEIKEMSAFETLEALARNELENTNCSICLCPFGEEESTAQCRMPFLVAMISCGHFFCQKCLDHYSQQRISQNRGLACPNCRKPYVLSRDVIHVDPSKKQDKEETDELRAAAKEKVRQASAMLEESNGKLDGSMWHALFLSFDLPVGCSTRGHRVLTAIPRDVLAHIRAATEMEIHCNRSRRPKPGSSKFAGRSSKLQALLCDLPLDERSIVFTGTREGVLHLLAVFDDEGIGCRALFTGQDSVASERAVADWEKDRSDAGARNAIPVPVLIVQAGAAASGLTLIKACKIFLLEPFARQEEEQQAYARCHRYGQKNDVSVRCYYSPVTVESRLLEWRNKAQIDHDSTNIVFSTTQDSFEEDTDVDIEHSEGEGATGDTETNEDMRRSLFLLGLADEMGNPLGVEEEM